MTNKQFEKKVSEVIETINDGISLMTRKEEYAYKQGVLRELRIWLNNLCK